MRRNHTDAFGNPQPAQTSNPKVAESAAPSLEEWRTIPGYQRRYEVSDHGHVRDTTTGQHLKQHIDAQGYYQPGG